MTEYPNRSARGRAPDEGEAGLRDDLGAPERRTRRDAVLGLVDAATAGGLEPATVGALVERLDAEPAEDVRQFVVEALGQSGADPATVRAALETAFEDENEWVRAEAVVAASRALPDPTDLLDRALDDDSGWVRRNAIIALGKLDAADRETLLDRLKTDPHPAVREFAAQHLGDVSEGREEVVRVLAAVLARDSAAYVRAQAATSLGDLGTDRAEEALETQGLPDRSDDVQRAARQALAAARGVEPDQLDVDAPEAPGTGPDRPGPRQREAMNEGQGRPAPQSGAGRSGGAGPAGRGPQGGPDGGGIGGTPRRNGGDSP